MRNQIFKQYIGFMSVLFVLSLTLAGCQKQATNNISHQEIVITQMYQYFDQLNNQAPQLADMQRFYTPNVVMITNGQIAAEGYQGFYQHFQMIVKHFKRFKFIFPSNAMITEGHKTAIEYNIELYSDHTETVLPVIAIFTFNNGKIAVWNEVASRDTPKVLLK